LNFANISQNYVKILSRSCQLLLDVLILFNVAFQKQIFSKGKKQKMEFLDLAKIVLFTQTFPPKSDELCCWAFFVCWGPYRRSPSQTNISKKVTGKRERNSFDFSANCQKIASGK